MGLVGALLAFLAVSAFFELVLQTPVDRYVARRDQGPAEKFRTTGACKMAAALYRDGHRVRGQLSLSSGRAEFTPRSDDAEPVVLDGFTSQSWRRPRGRELFWSDAMGAVLECRAGAEDVVLSVRTPMLPLVASALGIEDWSPEG